MFKLRQTPETAVISSDRYFTVLLEPPAKTMREAARLIPGMLDLALPMPVEDCALTWLQVATTPLRVTAFAIPAIAIAEAAEVRVVPEARPLWRAWKRPPTSKDALNFLVCSAAERTTLLYGVGDLLQSAIIVDDAESAIAAIAKREAKKVGEIFRCDGAFLARAVAADFAESAIDEGNFRAGALTHPAVLRQMRARTFASASALLLASLVLFGVSSWRVISAKHELDAAETHLTKVAERLAGRPLTTRGAAASAQARFEMADRFNPDLEAFMREHPFDRLPTRLNAAAIRGETLPEIVINEEAE